MLIRGRAKYGLQAESGPLMNFLKRPAENQYFAPAVSLWRHTVSPTKLRSTLSEHTTRSYNQLLRCEVCQQVGCKTTGAKAAQKMMVKLTPELSRDREWFLSDRHHQAR